MQATKLKLLSHVTALCDAEQTAMDVDAAPADVGAIRSDPQFAVAAKVLDQVETARVAKYRQLVAQCCEVPEPMVDEMLDRLVDAADKEGGEGDGDGDGDGEGEDPAAAGPAAAPAAPVGPAMVAAAEV
ncbi:hypothetical protein AMAG_15689 [Allomyces macrogynus ATCC 38327]|uniref:Uncharacterized protein n=1 Tax=Allomyces macrogynus (strain ATCC 38327) TaxID=578462 RepID=A0A0L0TAB2_ALLM3|nr:hypothetical protein AMAG_15689 [Allomyces macrogynus ATCC 38327]|eukprot:KNE71459.1 hypothetical protein AMAG_15689 [Allomyces macrogynus ATCC 38327]